MRTRTLRLVPATDAAACLIEEGFQIQDLDRNGRGIGFLFEDSPELQAALLKFANGQIRIEPRRFLRALNDLRDLARGELSHA